MRLHIQQIFLNGLQHRMVVGSSASYALHASFPPPHPSLYYAQLQFVVIANALLRVVTTKKGILRLEKNYNERHCRQQINLCNVCNES